jgi:hypothetical protein
MTVTITLEEDPETSKKIFVAINIYHGVTTYHIFEVNEDDLSDPTSYQAIKDVILETIHKANAVFDASAELNSS